MANLLPQKRLGTSWAIFRSRFLIFGFLGFLALAILFAAALLPAYMVVNFDYANPRLQQSGAVLEMKAQREELLRSQNLLARIASSINATSSPSNAVRRALALVPRGLAIDRIAVAVGKESVMTISGVTQSRDSLNEFRDALVKSGAFKAVTVPVSALVGADDGKFEITVTGLF